MPTPHRSEKSTGAAKGKLRPGRVNKWTNFFGDNLKHPKKDRATGGNTVVKSINKNNPPAYLNGLIKKPEAPRPPVGRDSLHSPTPSVRGVAGGTGSGPTRTGSTKGRRSGIGGPGGGGGGKRGGGGGGGYLGYPSAKGIHKTATKVVDRDIKTAIRALMNERGDLRAERNKDINSATDLFNRSEGDIRHVFGEAAEANDINTQKMLERMAFGVDRGRSLYDALVKTQEQTTDQNRSEAIEEMRRLGVQGGANLGRMESDANFANLMAQQTGANNEANLTAMGDSAANIGSLISQMAASSQAANIGRMMNTRNDEIAGARDDYRAGAKDIYDAARQERLQRGNRIQELYQQMEADAYDRWFQNREANRSNKLSWAGQGLAQSNFNLSVSKFNADQMWQQAALLQEQRAAAAEARNNRRALRGGQGSGYSPGYSADSFLWNR